jgi:hypothetical protein
MSCFWPMGALMRRLSSWWVLFAIACIVGLSSALADVPRQFVRPGETTILAEGKEEIALVGTYSSAVRLLKDVGNDGKPVYWVLTYTAANPPTATDDIVAFTKGGKQQSVIVSVSAVPQPNDPSLVSRATRLLFSMVVVAIILESAFAFLFNWRVFLEFFDGRGVRTVLMFVGAYLVVDGFNQDYVAALFQLYLGGSETTEPASTLGTKVLTALVLAGGSASVNSLMAALNLRQNRSAEEVTPKPPPTKAWIALKVKMKDATEIVEVILQETTPPTAAATRLMGVIHPSHFLVRLAKYFWRDVRRLPMSGGYVVDPHVEYTIVVRGRTKEGTEVFCDAQGRRVMPTAPGANTYEPVPRSYQFAPGAIVDFEVVL